MRIEWVENPARFAELALPWDELAADKLPYLRHGWFNAWWRAFGAGRALRSCVLWEGERMTGCLPGFRARGALRAMVGEQTPLFEPPAAGPAELRTLLAAVLESHGLLIADAVPVGGVAQQALGDAGSRLTRRTWQVSPIVDTTGSFEDYRERTRPSWLARLARYRRQMQRKQGLELTVAQLPEQLEPSFSEGLAVEASGWKGRKRVAVTSSPVRERFYREVAQLLWRSGELRLSMLRLNGRLAAFDFGFEHAGRMYSLKTGYDEAFRKVVPGLVLRLSLIEHCFEHGLEAHELLGTELAWKRNFATSSREHLHLRCYRGRARGAVGDLVHARIRSTLGRAYRAASARLR